jgi:hypothetical protein
LDGNLLEGYRLDGNQLESLYNGYLLEISVFGVGDGSLEFERVGRFDVDFGRF